MCIQNGFWTKLVHIKYNRKRYLKSTVTGKQKLECHPNQQVIPYRKTDKGIEIDK